MNVDQLRAALAPLLDDAGFIPGAQADERYCTDWSRQRGEPLAVLRPRDCDEVSRIMAVLHRQRQPVVVHGGMTGLVASCVPQPGEVVLSMERMRSIEEIDPVDGTATVQAGVCLETLQLAVQAKGQLFPVDIGSRGSCQIGGLIATNAGGNRVLRHGMMRRSVLGLEVVLSHGSVVSRLGKMRKDNAGYDLKQVFIGSEGTLGIITRAVLALQPLPTSRQSALVGVQGFEQVTRLLTSCRHRLGPRLTSFAVTWRDYYDLCTGILKKGRPGLDQSGSHVMLVEAMGMIQASDDASFTEVLGVFLSECVGANAIIAQSLADANALWSGRSADSEAASLIAPHTGFDISLPITQMEAWVADTHARLRDMGLTKTQTYGHLVDGNLHLVVGGLPEDPSVKSAVVELVHSSIGQLGGSISGEHGIGLYKKAHLHYCRSDAEIALMKTIKTALDPHGLLNRSRIFDLP